MAKWQRFNYPSCNPLGADGRRLTAGPAHIDISRRAALEGMVLLKNEGGALPLARGAKAALFGKGTFDYVKGGGGSGDVTVPYTHNLYDGMKAHADRVATFEPLNDFYRASVQAQYAAGRAPGMVDEPELPEVIEDPFDLAHDACLAMLDGYDGTAESMTLRMRGQQDAIIEVEFDWKGDHYSMEYDINSKTVTIK